ncbi:MAG: hypothetical protein ACXAEN_12410 [Candidatus Thorarchaeota archaeon]|jgi:hypothetical protein
MDVHQEPFCKNCGKPESKHVLVMVHYEFNTTTMKPGIQRYKRICPGAVFTAVTSGVAEDG